MRHKNGYWTYEKCKEDALKYNTKRDFKKNSSTSYRISSENNWLDIICGHMTELTKRNGYWNKENCIEESKKYISLSDLYKNNMYLYKTLKKNGWFKYIPHIKESFSYKIIKGYWTYERCKEEALKYQTKKDFRKNSNPAYLKSKRKKWLNGICQHMDKLLNHWTKEECYKESLKYNTKTELIKNNDSIYRKIIRENWIDEMCSHMKLVGNKYKRCIYVYEFDDNHAYIGLTCNLDNRNKDHLSGKKNSSVYDYIKLSKINPKLTQLTNYINVEEAVKMEKFYVEKYKKNNWIILNRTKTGGLGKMGKISKEKCLEISITCNSKIEFIKKNESVYNICLKNGWIDVVCKHMQPLKKQNSYYTKEKCLEFSLKCSTKTEFKKKYSRVYVMSCKNKFLNEICSHMKNNK